jgi:uroporphyrinogen decarboxylase
MATQLPLSAPQPDAKEWIDILLGNIPQKRTPLIEYVIDDVVWKPIVTDLLQRRWVDSGSDTQSKNAYLENFVQVWHRLGYDCVKYENDAGFTQHRVSARDPAPSSLKQREWMDEHRGVITTWEEFEKYPWPDIGRVDFSDYEHINAILPEGMGLITSHGGGIFEHVSWIMSYEGLCFALHDDPGLVKAVTDRTGTIIEEFYRHILDLDKVVAILQGDDMGFRTGPLIAPALLRSYFLPWHKRFARMTHERGIPYFLHSCGKVDSIMPDLIGDVHIDGKHSFEDAIIPVHEFQQRYGDSIAILGGLDVNILGAGTPEEVRKRTRFLIETCGARGRYAIGSGNSIPSYIPVENYLAMVDEALICGAAANNT